MLTSRTTVPLPVETCVVHGIHGSKLRIARSMSIDVNCLGSPNFSMIGVLITASSYAPGWSHGSRGEALIVDGVTIW